ncbi:putative signal peptide protein [Puccinia sorghi]|uniref:Putative signal peptide protein n=1 Tax=Puccinia sorghi TaxID=27349 RepID=A0A0L6UYZ6_9BASI|nr:putative signal peptide protein [Puccinia sorghi]
MKIRLITIVWISSSLHLSQPQPTTYDCTPQNYHTTAGITGLHHLTGITGLHHTTGITQASISTSQALNFSQFNRTSDKQIAQHASLESQDTVPKSPTVLPPRRSTPNPTPEKVALFTIIDMIQVDLELACTNSSHKLLLETSINFVINCTSPLLRIHDTDLSFALKILTWPILIGNHYWSHGQCHSKSVPLPALTINPHRTLTDVI